MKKGLVVLEIVLLIIYAFVVFLHVYFPKTKLNIWLSTRVLFAHFYSFPILFGAIISLIAVLAIIVGFVLKKAAYFSNFSLYFWLVVIVVSLILAIGGNPSQRKQTGEASSSQAEQGQSFKLVEWNTLNNFNVENARKIFRDFDADIAVFPELGWYENGEYTFLKIEKDFTQIGLDINDYQVFVSPETPNYASVTTVIVKKAFALYQQVEEDFMTRSGSLYLKALTEDRPDIVGIHTAPPLPGLMKVWREDLQLIANQIVQKYPEALLVGDFNATTKHGEMNLITSHEDALEYIPSLERGTWHSLLPIYLRTTIDHVLMPKAKFKLLDWKIESYRESDHACVYLTLAAIK